MASVRKVYRRTHFRVALEEINATGALDWPLSKQWTLVVMFAHAALRAGLVPSDAMHRALDALDRLRVYSRERKLSAEDQVYLQHLATGAMESQGGETGETLAYRAIEVWRLMGEWRAGRWPPRAPKKRPSSRDLRRTFPDSLAHIHNP